MAPKQAKRYCSCRTSTFSDKEYPELTINMTGRDSEKDQMAEFEGSSSESDNIYQHTRSRVGIIPPIDFKALLHGLEASRANFALQNHQLWTLLKRENSEKYSHTWKALLKRSPTNWRGMPKPRRSSLIWFAPNKKLSTPLRQWCQYYLKGRERRSQRLPFPQAKKRRRKSWLLPKVPIVTIPLVWILCPKQRISPTMEITSQTKWASWRSVLKLSPTGASSRGEVTLPYLAEWDMAPYPSKFNALTLQAFDDIEFPKQHISNLRRRT